MSRNVTQILYHVGVVLLSAFLALSLPFAVSFLAKNMLASWAFIENEKIFLAAIEIAFAVTLIVTIHFLRRVRQDRRLARTARNAGLVLAARPNPLVPARSGATMRSIKKDQGFAREILIIGSTGYRSFVLREGDLHESVQHCREAKIMLLDPREYGAIARANSIPDPDITPELIREQILKSIQFIREMKNAQKAIRLKLYPDMPLLKMAVLGDYVYLRHYHTGLNIQAMPEFAFKNIQHHGGLYLPLYRYFLSRWQDPDIPEYDFSTDELVYRDRLGYEVLREPFEGAKMAFDEQQAMEPSARSLLP